MRKSHSIRRSTAMLVVALGLLVFSSAGAGAAGIKPVPLQGLAHAEALHIKLQIPGTAELLAALANAGVSLPQVPSDVRNALSAITIDQAIAVSDAKSQTDAGKVVSSGYAQPVKGNLVNTPFASSSCSASACDGQTSSVAAIPKTVILDVSAIPGGLGTLEIAGAKSVSKTPRDTSNTTALIDVNVTLENLLAVDALAPVKTALQSLVKSVNEQVLPQVNGALSGAHASLEKLMNDNGLTDVNDVIRSIVEVGTVKDIPDLTSVDLLNLTVLGSEANVTRVGKTLEAVSSSKVADVRVLGNWLTIESLVAKAKTLVALDAQGQASTLAGSAPKLASSAKGLLAKLPVEASRSLTLTEIDLGGLLKIHTPEAQLLNDAAFNRLKAALRKDAPAGLEANVDDIIAGLDILYTTAGVKLERVAGFATRPEDAKKMSASSGTAVSKIGNKKVTTSTGAANLNLQAEAVSDRLVLTVEPKIPLVANGVTPAGALVPRLGADDYVSTGIKLTVEFPQARTKVAQGAAVLGYNIARTGVGINWIAIGVLIGAAVMVRRFALSK